jgi:hypothetical protein
MVGYILIGLVVVGLTIGLCKYCGYNPFAKKKTQTKLVSVTNEQGEEVIVKVEVKEEVKKYMKIEEFDVKKETAQLFSNTFYSIMNEAGWKMSHWYDSIKFEKEDKTRPIRKWCTYTKTHVNEFLKLCVEVNYEFNHKTGLMSMKKTELECDTKYTFEGEYDEEFVDYIYNCYYAHKTAENKQKQDAFDNSCRTINSILGKTVERGSKLNELLK